MIKAAARKEVAVEKMKSWWQDYNENRPHSSLGNVPPAEFASWHIPSASAAPQPSECTLDIS